VGRVTFARETINNLAWIFLAVALTCGLIAIVGEVFTA
jgi:hypothetical protein